MATRPRLQAADLRGAARLAVDATAGLTDLIEAVHARIARVPGLGATPADNRSGGISGLIYKTVRGVTRLVGGSVDALLALLAPLLGTAADTPRSAEREAVVAALNGVLGDHLAATNNPLAIPMRMRGNGAVVQPDRASLAQQLPAAGPRLVVLLHGLCMNDLQWSREGHDHGAALARECGYTPVYLQYNSGLPIATNGRALAVQLERLIAAWPVPLERIVLLGHSMGGLVARSALHFGAERLVRVSDLVCLGTPHHGAPLERAGHWVDLVLGATPYASPFARLGRIRSAGITDLRHGRVVDDDDPARPRHLPLPDTLRCFAIAASLGEGAGNIKERLLGDGLVPLDSALGRHKTPARTLAFAEDRQWIANGVNHLDLLSSAEVFAQLKQWLN